MIFESIQAALQLRAHKPHPLHFSTSITGLKKEKRVTNPKTVPTGQIVLQYVRPLRQANRKRTTNVTSATPNVATLLSTHLQNKRHNYPHAPPNKPRDYFPIDIKEQKDSRLFVHRLHTDLIEPPENRYPLKKR